jgi:hypothetical protein
MNLGSPPDWVSAFANLGVLVIALTLLRGAHVRARKAELSLVTADGERRRSITNHFLEILDYAGDATAEALSAFSIEQADHIYYEHYALYQAALCASERRIERIQSLSDIPMDIYCLCDRLGTIFTSPRLGASLDETAIEAMDDLQRHLNAIRENVVLTG